MSVLDDPEVRAAYDDLFPARDDDARVLAEVQRDAERQCGTRFPRRWLEADTDHAGVLAWVDEFHADPTNASWLLLLGPTGTGKTHAAYAALRKAVAKPIPSRAGYRKASWEAMTHPDFCAALRPRPNHDPEAALARYRKLDLLFIDDLGSGKTSEFVEESTYRLLDERYRQMRPCIATSNLPPDQLKAAIGDRIASRLVEVSTRITLDGPDRRRQAGTRARAPERPDPAPQGRGSGAWWNN